MEANIFNNFPANDWLVNIAKILFSFNVILTYPIKCILLRKIFDRFLFSEASSKSNRGDDEDDESIPITRGTVETIVIVIFTYLISLLVSGIDTVLELVGGLSAAILGNPRKVSYGVTDCTYFYSLYHPSMLFS